MIIGLDIGKKKTGLAKAANEGSIAIPITTIRHQSIEELVAFLKNLQTEDVIEKIIIGLPLSLDGSETEQTIFAKTSGDKISEHFPKAKIMYIDERLTTFEAQRMFQEKHTQEEDAIAAQIILQQYIDSVQG